ncbi:MAG: MBL fold metallo-hydrolase [Actinobacteria bacterium]|nr:MBL fold metallo-hydrolase [Actinomycetota bacterium]
MKELAPSVWTHVIDAEGFPTLAAVLLMPRLVFVVDTLTGPTEVAPVVDFLASEAAGRRVVVIDTHHHWDHVFGNSAFPEADIVAQRACPRLIQAELQGGDESLRLPPPEGVPLPNVTFGDRLTYSDAEEAVHLIHTPGHSEDSLVVFLPQRRLLLGGDTVEWPLPNFGQRDGADEWIRTLRQLKQLPVDLIVPSHGPTMGKTILDANERYIAGVYEAVAEAKAAGADRNELDLPVERFLPGGVVVDDVYADAHRENLLWAWDEI